MLPDWVFASLIAVGGILAAQIAYLIGTVAPALILRLPVDIVSLGTGPELVSFKIGSAKVRFAPFFVSGYVRFADPGFDETHPDHRPPGTFIGAPWWQRLIVTLAGPLAMISLGAIWLGADAFRVAAGVFGVVGDILIHPFRPIEVINLIAPMAREQGIWRTGANISAFAGGLQFLPLATIAGGGAIMLFAEAFHGRPLPHRLQEWLYRLSFVALLILFVLALIGVIL